jgi:hypothetical protein
MLLNIVPKLAAHIDSDFEVNPLDQKMEPLNRVLRWSGLLRDSTFAQIIEEKFFPTWLDTLHFWLIQPNYSAGEVASWLVEALIPPSSLMLNQCDLSIGITSGRSILQTIPLRKVIN